MMDMKGNKFACAIHASPYACIRKMRAERVIPCLLIFLSVVILPVVAVCTVAALYAQ